MYHRIYHNNTKANAVLFEGDQLLISSKIKEMFKTTTQGFWYDFSDFSTMYQDAAGTIPVTGVGQPIGLILDKSKELLIGGELWQDSSVSTTGESSKVSTGVYRIYSSSGAYSSVQMSGLIAGSLYKLNLNIDSITQLGIGVSNEGTPTSIFNSLGQKTVYFFATGNLMVIKRAGTACDIQVSNVSVKRVSGNHAYQTTSSSRPLLQKNSVTGDYYASFDGVDDFLQTSAVNFSTTDKISLFAGVRKLSDSAVTTVIEFSSIWTSFDGTFVIHAPSAASNPNVYSGSHGNAVANGTQANIVSGLPAPISLCLAAKHNISGDLSTLKVNGVSAPTSTADKGSGNFGNYPLYIGRRGGTSLPFGGHIYSLIGFDHLVTDTESKLIEKEIAVATGVILSA